MFRFLLAAPPLLLALPAAAADRAYTIGSFERIRVEGPFRVDVTLGKSPAASAQGDMRNTDRLNVRVEGDMLIVSANSNAWQEQANARDSSNSPAATILRVSTPNLRAATVIGGGQVTITGPMRGQRVDLSITGTGALTATGIVADQLIAAVTGSGTLTLAGKASKTRLSGNGPTRILAEKLIADDLSVRTDGSGDTVARARYTANINAAGIGGVTVYGTPTCVVNANVQGPVSCGERAAP